MILANDGVDQRCRRKLESSGDVVVEIKLSHEELQGGLAKEFDCIIVRSATNLTKEVIQANTGNGSKLKLLIRAGVGLDNIDTTFAESVGLIVRNTPNASTNSVVEMTISHLLCGSRKIVAANLDMKNGEWSKKKLVGSELRGKNLGLIGYGRIARGVARIASTLGMIPHAYDPFVDPKLLNEDGVVYHDTVESLFSNCTHISVHCSKTKETESMVNKDLISLMPHRSPSGIECGRHVVNCARGELSTNMICSNCWNQGFFLLLDSMSLKMNLGEIWLCPNIETSHQHHTQGLLQWRHSEELGTRSWR